MSRKDKEREKRILNIEQGTMNVERRIQKSKIKKSKVMKKDMPVMVFPDIQKGELT